MIPFVVVKTKAGFSYVRPDQVLAVNATGPDACAVVMTGGVAVAAAEPAEDIVERLEAEARAEEDAELIKEQRSHGHVPR